MHGAQERKMRKGEAPEPEEETAPSSGLPAAPVGYREQLLGLLLAVAEKWQKES